MARSAGRIDVHHHLVPPTYAALLRERGLRPGGVEVPSWTPEKSLRLMRRNGIATSILSMSTPCVWFGDDGEARHLAREVNEYAAGVVADHPGRFGFFATLTLPDVDGAIAEADHTLDQLGADGRTWPSWSKMPGLTGLWPQLLMPWWVATCQAASSSGVTTFGFQPTSSSKPDGVTQ